MATGLAKLCDEVIGCNKCEGICNAIFPYGKEIALSYLDPKIPAEVLFVAESPPGSPGSRENFFYNEELQDTRFRERLFKLISLAGLTPASDVSEFTSRGYYLADAINCRCNKDREDVRQPSVNQLDKIINNCMEHLIVQIQTLKPKAVVLLGKVAQKAGESPDILGAFRQLNIPEQNIVRMPFILICPSQYRRFSSKTQCAIWYGAELDCRQMINRLLSRPISAGLLRRCLKCEDMCLTSTTQSTIQTKGTCLKEIERIKKK